MKQWDLERCRGEIEEVVEGKAQVLLVGEVRRVQVDNQKPRTEVERVEVLLSDFAAIGQHALLGSRPKAAYKKMVLTLHQDKNKNKNK